MEYDVFISYSTKDQKVSDMVCNYLEDRGLRCFISSRDIPKGVEWPSAIAAALKTSRLFLAVFSNNYNLSMQVNKELTIASKRHIPLLTFKTTEDDFEGTKDYFLSEVNFITAYPNPEEALKPLYEDISALLKKSSSTSVDAPEQKLSFTYQEDREHIVKELLSQKPKDPSKQLDLASRLSNYKEWQAAFYWYKKAAEKENPDAIYHLADCFHRGVGVKADDIKAIELFEKAYGLGIDMAANQLGHLYYDGGKGVEPDYLKSLEWFEKANTEKCPETLKDLANYYSEGKACSPDEAKEFAFRKKYYDYHFYNALENEDVDSMYILGTLCEGGLGVDQNDTYAFSWYDRAAKNGSSIAKYRLGEIYEKGQLGVAEDAQKAFQYIEEASTYYDLAMVRLGDYYRKGIGTAENKSKAFQCYLLASSVNNAEACYKVGNCYNNGYGTSKNTKKAEDYYLRAAKQDYTAAITALGILLCKQGKKKEGIANLEIAAQKNDAAALKYLGFVYGDSIEDAELEIAINYLLKASEADKTDGDSLTKIGRIYEREGSLHDEQKAFDYYQLAAKRGQYGAMRSLAGCYVHGRGVEVDDFMAFYWANKAVELDNKKSLNTLGEFYRFGIGTKKNPEKAIECYKKSFEAGYGKIGALNIGEMYFYGEGVPVDYDEATKWFQKACDPRLSQPYVLIGRMYEMGVYGEKNVSQAISWYKKGEQLGSPFADYYLGCCYANDEIMPEPKTAFDYYSKASDAGLMEAKMELAKCFSKGLGVDQDNEKAFSIYKEITQRWLELRQAVSSYVTLARSKGSIITCDRQSEMKKPAYSEAMYCLGQCYIQGLGTDVNIPEGVKWITIAAKLGNEEAANYNLSESFNKTAIKENPNN